MGRNDEAWTVFWCSLLSPLKLGEIPERERERYFQKLSCEERLLPSGKRGYVSVRTLRRKWRRLEKDNVAALYRRRRSDRGQPRKRQADLLTRALELKREQPRRSAHVINAILKREFGREVPASTLYRHLRDQGATKRKLGFSKEPIRCRWTRDQSNALWVGDFEHGPIVMHQGRAVKTHLSIWIDCYSRFVVGARYYVRENLDILVDSLLRAWGTQGASRELYVDNAKVYHAGALKLACTQLGIKLLHRPPRDPPAGGLVERIIQTLQMQLEAEVRASEILSLEELNLLLAAWLETDYHRQLHSETRQTPHDRYHESSRFTRQVNLNGVLCFFHQREKRTVNEDFSDVQVDYQFFAVDPKLRGDRVIVEYDPFSPMEEVAIYSLTDVYLGPGKHYRREKGSHPEVKNDQAKGPVTPYYLEVLRADRATLQAQKRKQGIDYHSAQNSSVWSLANFAQTFARLLGRKGGTSALSTEEMQVLATFHQRHPVLHETLLREAFAHAESASIRHVLFQLQFLLNERST
jgi:transposase InsO family protein